MKAFLYNLWMMAVTGADLIVRVIAICADPGMRRIMAIYIRANNARRRELNRQEARRRLIEGGPVAAEGMVTGDSIAHVL